MIKNCIITGIDRPKLKPKTYFHVLHKASKTEEMVLISFLETKFLQFGYNPYFFL